MHAIMVISSIIGGFTVLYFLAALVAMIVDKFLFVKRLKHIVKTNDISTLPKYKQDELTSRFHL